MTNQESRERGAPINISAYVDESERYEKFRTVFIRDDKINDHEDNGDDPTVLSSGNKDRDNPEVWGSEARMVENYKGCTPMVEGTSRTIAEYCGHRNDENGTGKNRTQSFLFSSTARTYVTASRVALRLHLLGGRNGI